MGVLTSWWAWIQFWWVLTSWWAWIQFYAGALERMCLPVGSFWQVFLTAGSFCDKPARGFARDFQLARAMFVKTMLDVRLVRSCRHEDAKQKRSHYLRRHAHAQ